MTLGSRRISSGSFRRSSRRGRGRDPVADAHHDPHVMFDEQDRQAVVPAKATDEAVRPAVSFGFIPAVGS